jgi:hypothetical protein
MVIKIQLSLRKRNPKKIILNESLGAGNQPRNITWQFNTRIKKIDFIFERLRAELVCTMVKYRE